MTGWWRNGNRNAARVEAGRHKGLMAGKNHQRHYTTIGRETQVDKSELYYEKLEWNSTLDAWDYEEEVDDEEDDDPDD